MTSGGAGAEVVEMGSSQLEPADSDSSGAAAVRAGVGSCGHAYTTKPQEDSEEEKPGCSRNIATRTRKHWDYYFVF